MEIKKDVDSVTQNLCLNLIHQICVHSKQVLLYLVSHHLCYQIKSLVIDKMFLKVFIKTTKKPYVNEISHSKMILMLGTPSREILQLIKLYSSNTGVDLNKMIEIERILWMKARRDNYIHVISFAYVIPLKSISTFVIIILLITIE